MQNHESKKSKILIHVVTHNNESTIESCLKSLQEQVGFELWQDLTIRVTDNASSDTTVEKIRTNFSSTVRLYQNTENKGFCEPNNVALRQADKYLFDYLLLVNPDLRLAKDALQNLVATLDQDRSAAITCPMLLRSNEQLEPVTPQRYDAAGMYITPSIRHFDRGSNKKCTSKLEQPAYVFGASGACLLLRISAASDLSLTESESSNSLELFDEAFFAYREDADLAWRAAWLGWKIRYQPKAVGYHLRKVLPKGRARLPSRLNFLGVQNRFLLQMNNFSFALGAIPTISLISRNIVVLLALALWEKSSRGAIKSAWSLRSHALKRREILFQKARELPHRVSRWFSYFPYTEPVLETAKQPQEIRSLTIVVVNYNSGNRLNKCLRELAQAQPTLAKQVPVTIVVVDNSSHDASASRVKPLFESFSGVEFIINQDNLGFAAAINQAANAHPADAYLVLNPDVVVRAKAINHLLENLRNYPTLGAISPVLLDELGKSQLGFIARRFPSLSATLCELFFLHRLFPNNAWTQSYRLSDEPLLTQYLNLQEADLGAPGYSLGQPVIVDQPAGACLMIRGTAFEILGGFDETFWPAWFEDVDFCKRLEQADFLSAVTASATAKHEGGHSLHSLSAGKYIQAWYGNLTRYWKKHGNLFQYLVIRASVPVALLLRLLYFSKGNNGAKIYSKAANTDDLKDSLLSTAANPTKKNS